MVEVLFGESEAGLMKFAKSKGILGNLSEETSDVICLGWRMELGDIQKEATSAYRQNILCSMYADSWKNRPEVVEELRLAPKTYSDGFQRLKQLADCGQPIRIWYSGAPDATCGFFHLCSLLETAETQISTVFLPPYVVKDSVIVEYANWGEVSFEELSDFLPYEKPLTKLEISMFSAKWRRLQKENSPLRAVINGQLTSVGEEFYDILLTNALARGPKKEIQCIGEILGAYPTGMRDDWYKYRIEALIQQGKSAS